MFALAACVRAVALEFVDDVAKVMTMSGDGTASAAGAGSGGVTTAEEALAAFRAPSSPLEEYTSGEWLVGQPGRRGLLRMYAVAVFGDVRHLRQRRGPSPHGH